MDVHQLRKEIPATQRVIYMNTGWSGPSPRAVVEAVKERLEFESYEGPTARHVLESRSQIRDEARRAFADLLGATSGEITLTENTTEGINIVLNGLPWHPGDQVITDNLEHSSGLVPSYYLRMRKGVQIRIVGLGPHDDPATVVEKFQREMTSQTRLLLISHIMYCNGLRLPLKEIQELAHRNGAQVLVDGAQSVGQIPMDMKELDCDFYAFPAHKWLLGPDGVGALYVRRELIPSLEPSKVAGRAAAFYDPQGHFQPAKEDIRKFELTTNSTPLLAGAVAAIRFLKEIGLDKVEERALALAAQTREALLRVPGLAITSPMGGELASGLVTFSVDNLEPRKVVEYLWDQRKIVARSVSYPSGIRLSLDFFNTEEEIEKVAGILQRLVAAGK